MENLRRHTVNAVTTIVSIVLLFTLIAAVTPRTGYGQKSGDSGGPSVTIANTPLPVTGTVAATQSGAWNVGIAGTPNVAIAGTPSVAITGTPSVAITGAVAVHNIDEKGRIPYQQAGATSCSGLGLCDLVFPAVPAGKRLVVENVSANIYVGTVGGVNGTFLEGAGGFFVWTLSGRSMDTPQLIGVNERVLAYFEAGQTPLYRVAFSSSSNNGSFQAVIAGYLVDLSQ